MNIPATEMFVDAIRSIPRADIQAFFKDARQESYEFIRAKGTPDNPKPYSLTDIEARVILLDELENYFLRAKENQVKKITQLWKR
jgi:hypothetical protein